MTHTDAKNTGLDSYLVTLTVFLLFYINSPILNSHKLDLPTKSSLHTAIKSLDLPEIVVWELANPDFVSIVFDRKVTQCMHIPKQIYQKFVKPWCLAK